MTTASYPRPRAAANLVPNPTRPTPICNLPESAIPDNVKTVGNLLRRNPIRRRSVGIVAGEELDDFHTLTAGGPSVARHGPKLTPDRVASPAAPHLVEHDLKPPRQQELTPNYLEELPPHLWMICHQASVRWISAKTLGPFAAETALLKHLVTHHWRSSRREIGLAMLYQLPLVLGPQPEGGYTVTSPMLPELITEGDSIEEAMANVRDAFAAVLEIYQDQGKPLPSELIVEPTEAPVHVNLMITRA